MRKIISVVVALLILSLFSCVNVDNDGVKIIDNDVDQNVENIQQGEKDPKVVIYYEDANSRSAIECVISDTSTKFDADLKSVDLLNFKIHAVKQVEKASTVSDTMKFTICGKEYEVNHKFAYRLPIISSEKEYLKNLAESNLYKSDDIIIEYRSSTNEILNFTRYDINTSYKPTKYVSEAEIQNTVINFLNDLYGDDYMKDYELSFCELDSSKGIYSVEYMRNIHGFTSDNYVYVSLYADGIIRSLIFKNKGIYDRIESEVSKKTFDKAYNYMIELLNNADLEAFEDDIDVIVDSKGDCFLKFVVPSGNSLNRYYVNLNQFQ